jgi:nitrogen PTS system EIIA component
MKLACYLNTSRMLIDLKADSKETLFSSMVKQIEASGVSLNAEEVVNILLKRESESPTGIGHGLAIPHAALQDIDETVIAVARLAKPMKFGASDRKKVQIVIMVLGPTSGAKEHLGVLARIARIFSDGNFIEKLCGADNVDELRQLLVVEDERRVG